MRQIGDDLQQDPRVGMTWKAGPFADMNDPSQAAAMAQFTYNKFAEMSRKYCSKSLDLSAASFSDIEANRYKTCMSKYSEAFNMYQEESSVHFAALAAIDKVGGDRYAKFNEYDRF